jgi:hypothetical protein
MLWIVSFMDASGDKVMVGDTPEFTKLCVAARLKECRGSILAVYKNSHRAALPKKPLCQKPDSLCGKV